MLFETAVQNLKTAFAEPLPGYAAQNKMAPVNRIATLEGLLRESVNAKKSAVLILIYPLNEIAYTVLIERINVGNHAGQISFAGGKTDASDTSSLQSALREFNEELGVKISEQDVIGKLTDIYIPPSNFLVHPFVALMETQPVFELNKSEVEKILEIQLSDFMKPEIISIEQVTNSKKTIVNAPCYILKGVKIWGATAMMMSELVEMIQTH